VISYVRAARFVNGRGGILFRCIQGTHGMAAGALATLRVRTRPGDRTKGWLIAGPLALPVALGRAGIRADKREGDGATPRGTFRLVRLWFRADRGPRPMTRLPVRRVRSDDAWCEDPADRRYNRPFRLALGEAGDRLRRDDHLYDLIIEIDQNMKPRIARRGSAVFIHVARPGFAPTQGCVALRAETLKRLLERVRAGTRIDVQ
jgi:L,D-peptidoglycan transpeptidase YkuD (ErfK/YbiS/YcfS/YnhG family)